MAKKVLIITDNTVGKFAGRFSNGENLHILTLGFPGIELLNNSVFKRKDLGFTYEFINLKHIKNKAQSLTLKYCLDAKSRYSKLMNGNRELFSYDGINTWWFTAFSEMGSFRTNFVENIYFLSLIKLTIVESYDRIHLDIENVDILLTTKKCLKNLKKDFIFQKSKKVIYHKVKNKFFILFWLLHRLKLVTEQLIKLFFIKIFNIGFNPKSDNERVLLFSFYPLLWGKNETGTYEFRIFKDFKIESKNSMKVNYLIYTESIKSLIKTVLIDGNVFKRQEIVLLEKYLKIFEVFSLFNLKMFKQIINYIAFSKNSIKDNFFEFETSSIIINAINQSLLVSQLPRDVLLFKSIKNLLHQVKIHGIIHASEFQCHEKAIWYACADKCQTYAIQHSAIGKNWTNYYFNDGELKISNQLGNSIYMPMPNYYLTSGKYPFRVMLENGIDKKILRLIGAIRYDSLFSYLKQTNLNGHKMGIIKNNDKKTKILLLTSVNRNESINMILSTLSAIDNDYTLFFKSHPLNILDFEVKKIFKKSKRYQDLNIIPSEENYFDYIINSNVVIFCNSTTGIESIALGIPSISFENYNSIKSYDIIEVDNSLYRATNAIEIQSAIQSIRTEDSVLTKKKKSWEKTISDTFYKLDGLSGNRLIDIINNNIN